jgi:hypothetical protein
MTEQRRFDEITRHTSPALVDQLRQLGQQYGPLGVALAAARLTDQNLVVERITAFQENRCPSDRVSLPDVVASGQEPGSITAAGGWCAPTQAELHSEPENRVGPHEFEPLSWITSLFRHRGKCARCYLHCDLHPTETWAWARPIGGTSLIRKG